MPHCNALKKKKTFDVITHEHFEDNEDNEDGYGALYGLTAERTVTVVSGVTAEAKEKGRRGGLTVVYGQRGHISSSMRKY